MIATDLQPVSIVEDKGFRNLIHILDSQYEVQSRRTVMSNLPETYENLKKKKLQPQLNDASQLL